jgi:hypothetical protein
MAVALVLTGGKRDVNMVAQIIEWMAAGVFREEP